MAARKQVRYYKTFQDDFVESAGQDFTLRSDYVWIRDGRGARLLRAVLCAIGYVYACMQKRSRSTPCQYVEYRPTGEENRGGDK